MVPAVWIMLLKHLPPIGRPIGVNLNAKQSFKGKGAIAFRGNTEKENEEIMRGKDVLRELPEDQRNPFKNDTQVGPQTSPQQDRR